MLNLFTRINYIFRHQDDIEINKFPLSPKCLIPSAIQFSCPKSLAKHVNRLDSLKLMHFYFSNF